MMRYDISLDRKLREVVDREIHNLYWHLHSKLPDESFSMHDLVEALIDKGYSKDEEEEHVRPYLGYMCSTDYITLIRLHNGDCCIKQYRDSGVEIFVGRDGSGGLYLSDTTLSQTIDIIIQIDDALPNIIQKCKDGILKEEKKAKLLAINKTTVKTVLASALKDTGILYKLSLGDRQAMLILKLDNDLETKLYLPYKDFMKKIPFIKTTVEQLNGIMRQLEQPLRIKGTYYKEKDTWTESK